MLELYGQRGMPKLGCWGALGFQEFADCFAVFASREIAAGLWLILMLFVTGCNEARDVR